MRLDLDNLGGEWLEDAVENMDDHIDRLWPIEYNEQNRYIPAGLSPRPGYISFDRFPFWVEIVNSVDARDNVREINVLKGVQVGYNTACLDAIIFYEIGHVKTQSMFFFTADRELAKNRVETHIIPMINESGLAHVIRSADEGNNRKTGKTKDYIQWEGGGTLYFNGALNATKMRSVSVPILLKDEMDGWPKASGKDGDSDTLTDARAKMYEQTRKIFRGSTPSEEPSLINSAYLDGDQRKYHVNCIGCGHPQFIDIQHKDDTGKWIGGFKWEKDDDGLLIRDSVRYHCLKCGHAHSEYDKTHLFSPTNGAKWIPTAKPRKEFVRSYHLPAFYSPVGLQSWAECISDFLACYDPETNTTLNFNKYKTFRNNILGLPFRVQGEKIKLEAVSGHRRTVYRLGEIPNGYAEEHSGSKILFLTCQVDVHDNNLAVSVMGWARDARCYLIDYWRFESEGRGDLCTEVSSTPWRRLAQLIEPDNLYTASDGTKYAISMTLIDSGYSQSTVSDFCSNYNSGVYPIAGKAKPARNQLVKEFSPFHTQAGIAGYNILVDHYKERIAKSLRRQWAEYDGQQKEHHFNAPVDATDAQLKELTTEYRAAQKDQYGNITGYKWHRPGNVANELWDLLVYGHCAVEIYAFYIFKTALQADTVDMDQFWDLCADPNYADQFGRIEP